MIQIQDSNGQTRSMVHGDSFTIEWPVCFRIDNGMFVNALFHVQFSNADDVFVFQGIDIVDTYDNGIGIEVINERGKPSPGTFAGK